MGSIENRILVTGASGQYGRLAVDGLLAKGVSPSSLLLLTRDPAKLADYAAKGSSIRQGSFDDPVDSLAEAFTGADTMLFISTSRAGQRLPQHQAAVDAAVKAGITHIVYTSILSAHLENPTALVAREHRATGNCPTSSTHATSNHATSNLIVVHRGYVTSQWPLLDRTP